MKTTLISKIFFPLLALTFVALAAVPASAECLIYKGHFGYDIIGHVESGVVYKERWGNTSVARIKDSSIYEGQFGYKVLAHLESGLIYRDSYGYSVLGRVEDDRVYDSQFNYNVVAHSEGCTKEETTAGGASVLLGLI